MHAGPLAGLAALATPRVRVAGPDTAGLAALAAGRGWRTSTLGEGRLEVHDVDPAAVGAAAFAAGLELHELTRLDVGLEQLFLDLVEPTGASAGRHRAEVA